MKKGDDESIRRSLILGVSGGIAAYKTVELLRLLTKENFDSWVVMTENAQRFIQPLTFAPFTRHPVITSLFDAPLIHIEFQKRDILLIAPATANIIGKIAHGLADDSLSTITCAFPGLKILVPAMNNLMWENPIVQENIKRLVSFGYQIMEPKEGELACGVKGKGRMPEPEEIVSFLKGVIEEKKILFGLKFLITAGRTEEDIDAVRVITNRASGRLGKELAEAAKRLGGECLLIAGRMEEKPTGVETIFVRTAAEMRAAIKKVIKDFDVLIMTAAVGDYRPVDQRLRSKIKEKSLSLSLVKNVDILKSLSEEKLFKVGFSLDVKDDLKEARRKLKEKKLDLICVNSVSSLESESIKATLLTKDGKPERLPMMTKREFSLLLLKKIQASIRQERKE